ncbi:ECF RNA polymerase sigma factor SigK [Aldersonia sp. NBC_00410]|jgi:RNA polymerase sigma-70 factor (ECF subfamily)|uniref:ECF RNA polymerase sigma factor SigK n=1 Tax=Aldersonia sp. NBC_00410 TaxID=2975954 RepID=UPI002254D160|nr:ECF RNA polymerase sigma factor SigK [Aldersonia sp. NBC_00410]MCX5044336.1 ECF RNA polymerase sigma factor SigK [Aldersonia sp. NBC_00410]
MAPASVVWWWGTGVRITVKGDDTSIAVTRPVPEQRRFGARPIEGGRRPGLAADERSVLDALVAAIATGDEDGFAELYDRTCARVYGVVVRVLRDAGYAEEVTQEVYLQAWNTAGEFDASRGSVLAWLLTLAHRRAVDRVRSEQAATDRSNRYETRNVAAAFDVVAEEVARRGDRRAVIDCLRSLTEVQREAVAMAYYDGRSYPEVASHLGVALPTVKSRIRDGLIRLRRCLEVS